MLVCRVQAPSLGCRGRGTRKPGPVCRKEAVGRVQLCDDLCPQVGICHDMQWVHTAQPLSPSTLASVPMGRAVNCFELRPWGCGIVEVMCAAQVTPALTTRERVRGWSPTPWTTLSWLFCSGAASFGQHPACVPWTHVSLDLGLVPTALLPVPSLWTLGLHVPSQQPHGVQSPCRAYSGGVHVQVAGESTICQVLCELSHIKASQHKYNIDAWSHFPDGKSGPGELTSLSHP